MKVITWIVIVLLLIFAKGIYAQDTPEYPALEYAKQAKSFFQKGDEEAAKVAFDKSSLESL